MRRLLPFLFLLACGTKHPPEDAHLIARPGEPCFEPMKPWEDPVGPPMHNTQNLPQCPGREFQHIDFKTVPEGGLKLPYPIILFGADAGRD